MKKIAVIGLGTMGAGMARNLLAAGFPVTVYNRSRERAEPLAKEGAKIAGSPGEAAAGADVVVSMVADDAASRSVFMDADGVLAGAKPGSVFIEASTLSPDWVSELAAAADKKGCALLDAPVTGSREHAKGGQLLFLVGGDPKVAEEMQHVFKPMARAVLYMGPSGSGSRIKLINNFVCGVQAASLAEALSLIERLGIDLDKAMQVIGEGAPGSPLLKLLAQRMIARDYDMHFDLQLMAKDLSYVKNLSAQAGLPSRTAEAALELYRGAVDSGWKKHDFSAVIEPLRKS